MCKQRTDKYRYAAPTDADRPTTSNFIIQIDFVGPLNHSYRQKYATTMVDIHMGLGTTLVASSP